MAYTVLIESVLNVHRNVMLCPAAHMTSSQHIIFAGDRAYRLHGYLKLKFATHVIWQNAS